MPVLATPNDPPANPERTSGTQVVANLEMMAEGFTSGLQTPTPTQNSITNLSSQMTSDTTTTTKRKMTKTNNKTNKSKKTKRSNTNTDVEDNLPTFDPADLKDSNKTAVELRCLAVKFASSGLTESVLESVLEFHEEIETKIAIKALELGITVSDIKKVFGKYIGVRRPSAWNRFLQSPTASAIFKEAHGVANGQGMKALSRVWKSMTQEEKDLHKEATQETDPTTLQNLDQTLEEMEVGPQSRQAILQPRSNTVINARNLGQYKKNAEDFMDGLLAKCVPVAKSNHFEVVLIAVSTHIDNHNFRITRSTVGLNRPVNMIYNLEGVQNFPVRLQALIVGKTAGELVEDIADNSARGLHKRVTGMLSSYLKGITSLGHWPWSNCDSTLAALGFELRLLPGARSKLETFKTPSNQLNQAKLLALQADLKESLIQLVRPSLANVTQTHSPANHTNNFETQRSTIDHTNIEDNHNPTTDHSFIHSDFNLNRSQDNHRPINLDPSLL
ncbi:hypothetical protein DFH28DRAFT_1064254 [Melampsora americana]|nr:hypothetical protein DFH28DRAFT_1064254 [Melampsora americana]